MYRKILFLISLYLLVSCTTVSSKNPISIANAKYEKSKFAYRFFQSEKNSSLYELKPAGKPIGTISSSNKQLLIDIFVSVNAQCGFTVDDLVETRVVSHDYPYFYEVWVFKDKSSKFENGLSALSVVMKQLPNGGGIDISLSSNCRVKPVKFYFG